MAQTTTVLGANQPDVTRPDRSRMLWAVVIACGWLAGVAWRLWLSRNLTSPSIRGDEDSYMLTARALVTGIGGETTENTLFRRTGYPLLLSPIYLLTRDPSEIYRLVQFINAVINSLLLPLAYVIGRRVFRWDRPFALLAAIAASTLPAVVFYTGLAMTDAVFAPILLGWLLACHAMINKPRSVWISLLAGVLAGLAYLIHIRGVVIAALHIALLLVLLVRPGPAARDRLTGRARVTPAAVSALAMVSFILINGYAIHILGDTMSIEGNAPDATTARSLASFDGALRIVMSAAGQLWYLAVIGFGFTAIGMLSVPRWLRAGPQRDRATGLTMVLALLATIGIAVLSAAALEGITPQRVVFLAYPRYVQTLAPWWLLTGTAALAVAPIRRKLAVPVLAGLLTAGVGGIVWYRMMRGQVNGFNVFDAPELAILADGWTRLRPVMATVVALASLILVVWLVGRARSRRKALVWLAGAVAAANLIMVPVLVGSVSVPMMIKTASRPSLADLGVHRGDIVAVDSATYWWQWRNAEREVTWAPIRRFGHDEAPPPDVTVVLAFHRPGSPNHWDGTARGFRLVGVSSDNRGVWRRGP